MWRFSIAQNKSEVKLILAADVHLYRTLASEFERDGSGIVNSKVA